MPPIFRHKVGTRISFPFGFPDTTQPSCYSFIFPPGIYHFDVFGAQGGSVSPGIGGKGGHSSARIRLHFQTLVYLCVGEKGPLTTSHLCVSSSSFGGGGSGGAFNMGSTNYGIGAAGGGASDVRIGNNSLNNRVIVAGGGGGGGIAKAEGESQSKGGYGGGIKGEDGMKSYYYNEGTAEGKGGNQTSGGEGTPVYLSTVCRSNEGTFGFGGSTTNGYCSAGGGGGGWFGGSSGQFVGASGGGGSGFLLNSNSYDSKYNALDERYFVYKGMIKSNVREGDGIINVTVIANIISHKMLSNSFMMMLLSMIQAFIPSQ